MTGVISTIDGQGVTHALRQLRKVEKSGGQPKKNSVISFINFLFRFFYQVIFKFELWSEKIVL